MESLLLNRAIALKVLQGQGRVSTVHGGRVWAGPFPGALRRHDGLSKVPWRWRSHLPDHELTGGNRITSFQIEFALVRLILMRISAALRRQQSEWWVGESNAPCG